MDTEATYNPSQDYVPISAPPDQSHQYTPVDIIAPNLSASLAPTVIPSTLTATSPAGSDDSESHARFPCPDTACSKRFAQNQGAWRHFKEIHHPDPCYFTSCGFTWGRKYVYRNHLRREHGLRNVDLNTILN